MQRLAHSAAALAVLLLTAVGCTPAAPKPQPAPSFLLVIVDTLRLDRLQFAGYPRPHTPNLDALRSQSVWFANAYTTSPWTLPAMTSLFTSQLGAEHGAVQWGSMVGPEQVTLTEMLRDAGYRTGAWTANFWLAPVRGLSQGFDDYELVQHPEREKSRSPDDEFSIAPAPAVLSRARAWLRAARVAEPGRPTFAYAHLMEPHSPYRCPPQPDPTCRETLARLTARLVNRMWDFTPEERAFLQERYAGEVARVDRALGKFLRGLSREGLLENTWIVFAADHGELLGERGHYLHGKALYQPLVHVPLLVSAPSREAGRVDLPVSLIDLAPTILELADVPIPPSFRGRSLVPALRGETLAPRAVVAELFMLDELSRHRLAVVDGGEKTLFGVDGGLERFDVTSDPEEQRPVPGDRARVDSLLEGSGLAIDLDAAQEKEAPPISPELHEQLQALGYAP